jgi:hypothetical protein
MKEESMPVVNWLKKHHAHFDDYMWGLNNCKSMQEVWDNAKPELLIWVATRPGVLDDIALRRFACWCVRQVWNLLTDGRSRIAVETAERFCDGKATLVELNEVKGWAIDVKFLDNKARQIASEAASSAAGSTPQYAADIAACAAAGGTWNATMHRDGIAVMVAQAAWLRANVRPNFND